MAGTSLRTKLAEAMASRLTDIVCDAVLTVRKPDEPIDLYMVSASVPLVAATCSWQPASEMVPRRPQSLGVGGEGSAWFPAAVITWRSSAEQVLGLAVKVYACS